MPDRATIAAAPRATLGKAVSRLRKAGRLPANVYGRGLPSVALEVDAHAFSRTIKAHGLHALYDLAVEGESKTRPVVLRQLTRKGGTGEPIHVDFFEVDTNRPIHATASLHLVGEAPAVRDLAGTLLHSIDSVAIRCLPLAIPDHIEVDVSRLTGFDISITVGDIVAPPDVEILVDPSVVVATVTPPRLRLEGEEEEKPAEEEEAAEEAAAEEAPAEAEES